VLESSQVQVTLEMENWWNLGDACLSKIHLWYDLHHEPDLLKYMEHVVVQKAPIDRGIGFQGVFLCDLVALSQRFTLYSLISSTW